MRRFVIIGQTARATPDFSLDDLPATSGRLDVLLRCARAALLVSHGVRRDTVVYLVLLGGAGEPRTLRIDGATAKFLRPDERSWAVMAQKALAKVHDGAGFGEPTRGVSLAMGGLEVVLGDLGPGRRYLLDEAGAVDVRAVVLEEELVFFLGDHRGVSEATRAEIGAATAIRVGPVSVHAEDALAVVVNEIDRQGSG